MSNRAKGVNKAMFARAMSSVASAAVRRLEGKVAIVTASTDGWAAVC